MAPRQFYLQIVGGSLVKLLAPRTFVQMLKDALAIPIVEIAGEKVVQRLHDFATR